MTALCIGSVFVLIAVLVSGVGGEGREVVAVASIVIAGLVLWTDHRISRGLVALVLLGIVDTLRLSGNGSAFEGFAQPAFFFFLALLYITTAIEHAGTAQRVAQLMIRRRRRLRSVGLLWRVPMAMVVSAVVISSATARTALVVPVTEQALRVQARDPGLRTYLTVFLSHLSPLSSRVFLSGGAGVIVAADALRNAGYSFSWWAWFIWIGIPTLVIVCISSLAHWLWLRPKGWDGTEVEVEPLDRRDKLLLGSVMVMLVAWILGPGWGVGAATAAILGMALTAAAVGPSIQPMKLLDWDLVVFVGGTLSLAHVVVASGTADWVGSILAGLTSPLRASPLLLPALLALFVALRLPLHNGVSYSAIVLPIALSIGQVGAADGLVVAFIAIISASITFLPIQATPAMLSHSRQPAAIGDSIISGTLNLGAALCVVLFIVGPYWSWLRRGG